MAVLGLHGSQAFPWLWRVGATFLSQCVGLSLQWLLSLQSADSRARALQCWWHAGSVVVVPRLSSTGSTVVAHGLVAPQHVGIFLDQGSNPRLLHWQMDSLPLEPSGKPLKDHLN